MVKDSRYLTKFGIHFGSTGHLVYVSEITNSVPISIKHEVQHFEKFINVNISNTIRDTITYSSHKYF